MLRLIRTVPVSYIFLSSWSWTFFNFYLADKNSLVMMISGCRRRMKFELQMHEISTMSKPLNKMQKILRLTQSWHMLYSYLLVLYFFLACCLFWTIVWISFHILFRSVYTVDFTLIRLFTSHCIRVQEHSHAVCIFSHVSYISCILCHICSCYC